MPIADFNTALDVSPGEEFAVRLSHESWPEPWPDETAFLFMAPHALLRVPCYAEGMASNKHFLPLSPLGVHLTCGKNQLPYPNSHALLDYSQLRSD